MLFLIRASEESKLSELLSQALEKGGDKVEAYKAEGIQQLKLFMRVENTPVRSPQESREQRDAEEREMWTCFFLFVCYLHFCVSQASHNLFYKLHADSTLKDSIENTEVVEFPTIHVLLPQEHHNFVIKQKTELDFTNRNQPHHHQQQEEDHHHHRQQQTSQHTSPP